jgi:hypothetical protein
MNSSLQLPDSIELLFMARALRTFFQLEQRIRLNGVDAQALRQTVFPFERTC